MASCNLSYSGNTSVIAAKAYVTEYTTSGTSRLVNLRLTVYAKDYTGARDAGYSVNCTQSGTNVSVPMYNGFTISGSEVEIFNETFYVSIAKGSSTASINLSFSAFLYSSSAGGNRSINGTITQLTLTAESDKPDVSASDVSLSADTVQMGDRLLISIDRDDPGCDHYLTCWFSDDVELEIADYVGTSYAWTVPDLAYLCNNKLSETFWIVCYTYYNYEYIGYTEAKVTLTVPDPTTPSIDGGEVTLGQACSIVCTRNSSNFTVKLEFEFKNTTVSITSGKINSASWKPAYDLAKQIPNLTYATGTLKCTTMNGTAEVGIKTATIKAIVPENDVTRPSFTLDGLVLTPISSLGEEFAGMYMRGKTGLKAEIAASSEYSTIQRYSITVGSVTAEGNPATIYLLANEGDVKVTAKVTDARGFSATVTTTIYILPYSNPKVTPYKGYSEVICERALSNGALDPNGTYLAIKAGKSYSSVVLDGKEKNSCVLRYRWKPNGVDAYSDWITLLADGSAETEVSMLIGNVVSSLQTSYMVQIEAMDALDGKHTLTFQIMTQAISFVLYDGPDGAGFGKYPEAPHVVDIASHMTLLVRGKLEVTSSKWVNLGLAIGINEPIYDGGRADGIGCHYLVSNGNHVYIDFNCSFTYDGSAKCINATRIPAEYCPAKTVYSNCLVSDISDDRNIAMVSVDPDGFVWVEFVQKLTETVNTGSMEILAIDGYLDYWK